MIVGNMYCMYCVYCILFVLYALYIPYVLDVQLYLHKVSIQHTAISFIRRVKLRFLLVYGLMLSICRV